MVISEKRRDLRRFYICRVIIIGAAANTSRVMLVVLIKSIITFFLVLLVVRLMGKRQLGEMQPFELVITLIIAEVACIPMNDPYIPFYAGIVPIVTLAFLQILLSTLARKSLWARRLMSGSSIIAIDKNGINYENLKKMNININDLIEAARSGGYMDFNQIAYAIFETNGNLCVIEKECDPTKPTPALFPLTLVVDGEWEDDNLALAEVSKPQVTATIKSSGVKGSLKEVLYMDVRQDGTAYIAPKHGKDVTAKLKVNGKNW